MLMLLVLWITKRIFQISMTNLQKLVYGDPISASWGEENRAKLDLWRWYSAKVNSLEDINEHYTYGNNGEK